MVYAKDRFFSWLFLGIVAFALFVRVYHHRHILMSDEANNMLTIKALIEDGELTNYLFKHPPLFILLAAGISYPFGDNHYVIEGISIVFSTLSFIPFFMIAEKIFDRRTALLSAAFLSVLPLNIVYSTWIKQDPMLLFFMLWSVYFYITDRPYKSGIIFGFASLTKEFAWFLPPIIACWELLKGWEGKETVKRFLGWLSLGAVLSGWWYMVFGETSFEAIDAAVGGENLFEFAWHHPWYYYIMNLADDITIALLPFFVIGLFNMGEGLKRLPLLWFSAFYLPLSLITVKAPWYTYLASPAMGMIIAVGFLKILDIVVTKWMRLGIITLSIGMALFYAYSLSSTMHYMSRIGSGRFRAFYEDEYFSAGRKLLKGEHKVAVLEYNPTLQYSLGIKTSRVFYIGSQFPAMNEDMLRKMVKENEIGWFAINTDSIYYLDKNIEHLTSLWGKPEKVGSVLIFRTDVWNFPKA